MTRKKLTKKEMAEYLYENELYKYDPGTVDFFKHRTNGEYIILYLPNVDPNEIRKHYAPMRELYKRREEEKRYL